MDSVLVMMSTFNGAKYLNTQIESILNQKDVKVSLLVRDDGSSDDTTMILDDYQSKGQLKWYTGKNLKPAKSFLDLVRSADAYDFYAFSDQDDYWLPEKLKVAVKQLKSMNMDLPALYYSDTILVDSNLKIINQKKVKREFTSFNQAVISSNATGCTMCFNRKLLLLLNKYSPDYQIMHDGWAHKLCLAMGGSVFYDQNSYIYYRQHGNNVIGGTSTVYKRWKRRLLSLKTDPCPRSHAIKELLQGYGREMPDENVEICNLVVNYKDSLKNRMQLLVNKHIYSSNKKIDLMYRLAVLLGVF